MNRNEFIRSQKLKTHGEPKPFKRVADTLPEDEPQYKSFLAERPPSEWEHQWDRDSFHLGIDGTDDYPPDIAFPTSGDSATPTMRLVTSALSGFQKSVDEKIEFDREVVSALAEVEERIRQEQGEEEEEEEEEEDY